MDKIEWRQERGYGLVPHVNGIDLRILIKNQRMRGLDPVLVKPPSNLLLGVPQHGTGTSYDPDTFGDRIPLLACGCGELGCAAVTAKIFTAGSEVMWDDIRDPGHKQLAIGPFRFARKP